VTASVSATPRKTRAGFLLHSSRTGRLMDFNALHSFLNDGKIIPTGTPADHATGACMGRST
jgi:hypothetical protein